MHESLCSANFVSVFSSLSENLSSDSALSSPSALNSPGQGVEGLNRRRKKRTSIETNIRVALEKSFLEVSEAFIFHVHGIVCVILVRRTVGIKALPLWMPKNIMEKIRPSKALTQQSEPSMLQTPLCDHSGQDAAAAVECVELIPPAGRGNGKHFKQRNCSQAVIVCIGRNTSCLVG